MNAKDRLRIALMLCTLLLTPPALQADEQKAQQILQASGVKGGLIVHIGCGDGQLTAALRANDRYIVHGLDTNSDAVAKARKYIHKLRLYGKVSVDQLESEGLPYADNLVNLLVVEELD